MTNRDVANRDILRLYKHCRIYLLFSKMTFTDKSNRNLISSDVSCAFMYRHIFIHCLLFDNFLKSLVIPLRFNNLFKDTAF